MPGEKILLLCALGFVGVLGVHEGQCFVALSVAIAMVRLFL